MLRRLLVTMLAGLLISTPAAAHSPVFHSGTAQSGSAALSHIADPERSWAVYGRLKPDGTPDQITIDAPAGQKLYVQMLVPVRRALQNFRPKAFLVGPGLPSAPPAELARTVGPNERVLEVPMLAEPKEIFEGFTQMRLWEYALASGVYPEDGRYRLVIFDPEGQAGPYTVAVGTLEIFGVVDTLLFPLIWVRAHVWLWK